jgi:hypothetical protein
LDKRRIVERYAQAVQDQNLETMRELVHEDIVVTYPQSGEVIRGKDTYLKMLASFPEGLATINSVSIHGDDKTIVMPSVQPFMQPTVTAFGGDYFWISGMALYPNGEVFHVATMIRTKGSRVIEETSYFAAPFEPPDWRAEFVEH